MGPAPGASPSGPGCKVTRAELEPPPGLSSRWHVGRQHVFLMQILKSQCLPPGPSSKYAWGLCQGKAGPTWSCRWCRAVPREGAAAFGAVASGRGAGGQQSGLWSCLSAWSQGPVLCSTRSHLCRDAFLGWALSAWLVCHGAKCLGLVLGARAWFCGLRSTDSQGGRASCSHWQISRPRWRGGATSAERGHPKA